MLFVIGAPRSGTTMLERMLSSHSMIQGGPEPHIMTPLAHLGVWAKVDKAPYDHILSAESQKLFVDQLPNREQDYWDACRAYCDVLYGRFLTAKGDKPVCLDKTPAYTLVFPFLAKVYPDAKYIILTRHPLAVFSSFANSFFDGDYNVANTHNPIINRYVPALANAVRQQDVPVLHVRYEDLVKDPETWFGKICAHSGIPFEKDAIDYGKKEPTEEHQKGLGDPIGVKQHTRPSTASVKKWVSELATDPEKLALMRNVINAVDPADLETIGYPVDTLWKPLEEAGDVKPPAKPKLDRYRLQRRMIIRLREQARKRAAFRALLKKMQLVCDVLLREE